MASNTTRYMIVLMLFIWNISVATTNELGVFDTPIVYQDVNVEGLKANITDLTDQTTIQSTDEEVIDLFAIPGMVVKSFVLLVACFASIPFTGVLLAYYGMPLPIAAMFEAINLLILAVGFGEFGSNRLLSR
jgi:hypothetical protein